MEDDFNSYITSFVFHLKQSGLYGVVDIMGKPGNDPGQSQVAGDFPFL
jgi:hypothetical protein